VALPDIRRQRAGYVFLAVVLGQILLISAQVNAPSGAPLLETVTFGVFAEVQRGVFSLVAALERGWEGYVALQGVGRENEALKAELADVQVQLQQQRALGAQSRSLEQLLDLRDRSTLDMVAATVIASGGSSDFRTITIDRGGADGVAPDMAVVAPEGVVGRVVLTGGGAAKVQLLLDRNAAAGALIERTRAQGVVVGGGDEQLRLEYVAEVADVVAGDVVVTSGIDGIFPKGFVIGRVASVEPTGGMSRRIVVTPSVAFDRLEHVLVVRTPPPDASTGPAGEEHE
jgi:rod shape-determining protein MreC